MEENKNNFSAEHSDNLKISATNTSTVNNRYQTATVIIFIVSIILAIIGFVNLSNGFDKKNNYDYKNKYVGGDAYNYQINAEYFTGYMILAGTSFVCSAILINVGTNLFLKSQD